MSLSFTESLCSTGKCTRRRRIARGFRRSRLHYRRGEKECGGYFALQASGEAGACPNHCKLKDVAIENADRQVAAARLEGWRIPYSFEEAAGCGDDLDRALRGLGVDILDEPIPPRLVSGLGAVDETEARDAESRSVVEGSSLHEHHAGTTKSRRSANGNGGSRVLRLNRGA